MIVARIKKWLPLLSLILTLCLLTACSLDSTTTNAQQTPTAVAVNVNGFGTALHRASADLQEVQPRRGEE